MDIHYKFKQMGFSENEAKTYIALLKNYGANLKELEKATDIHRANLLAALQRLEKRGDVGISLDGKRRRYYATKPETVLQRIVEKAEQTKLELLKDIVQLPQSGEHAEISVFYGKTAVKGLLDDELEQGKTINVIQSSKNIDAMAGQYLHITREKRWRKGMKMRIIYPREDIEYAKKAASVPSTEVKICDVDIGPVTVDVYGEHAALVFGNEPKVVKIISKDVAHALHGLFEVIWKQSNSMKKKTLNKVKII
ncbi:MAG: helix-turn-helix domain-containing protein [Candidatus Micrarchaeota archaeon]|nr:helix-turn-helix domain-containing protein [Candidatus Micrarchaeota archaeon]